MFTNLAQFRLFGIGRAQHTRSTIEHRIDGDSNDHFVATPHRARRPTLACRWRQAPSIGALECVWQSVEMPTATKPRPMRLITRTGPPEDALAAGERPSLRPAA
jgi:hypothetical protein